MNPATLKYLYEFNIGDQVIPQSSLTSYFASSSTFCSITSFNLVNLDYSTYTGTSVLNSAGITVPTTLGRLEMFRVQAKSKGGVTLEFTVNLEVCGHETVTNTGGFSKSVAS